jgi:hypothetical protein
LSIFRVGPAALGILAAVSTFAAAPATAEPEPNGSTQVHHVAREVAASPDGEVPADSVVVYWGFNDKGEFFQTVPLDASVATNRGVQDPDRVLPLDKEAKPTYTTADGKRPAQPVGIRSLYCERFISPISLSAGDLKANADQRCQGQFVNHWVEYRFERDSWRGWLGYTDWANSSSTSQPRYVWSFAVDCGAPGDTGTYNYRLNTKGHARHVNGTIVSGSPVWGGQGRYACGGGNGS